jgi:mannosyl-3-phosphoglycerate synthase
VRIEIPREFERFGPIMFYDVQKVYELDSGLIYKKNETKPEEQSVIKRISYESLQEIQEQMAIIVPVRNEKIKLIEGVLSGIPHHCQIIIVSNSSREEVDRFKIEKNALEHVAAFMKKNLLIVHQKDPALGKALASAGYDYILDEDGIVKNGKCEGMILSTFLAHLCGKKYIGFIDSDNYFPGAVHEYVQEYSAGLYNSKSDYSMVRIAWHSKPKIVESNLFFAKRGRASEHTNKFLNQLVSHYTGYGTEILKTGNAGEHAMSMELAKNLDFSSGYSIEPYHFISMFERFAAIHDNPLPEILKQGIEVYQIESRNPHLHEVKGDEHVKDMSKAALEVIYRSPLAPESLKKEILEDLFFRNIIESKEEMKKEVVYYPAIVNCDLKKLQKELQNQPYGDQLTLDLSKYKPSKKEGLKRDQLKGKPVPEEKNYLEAK